MSARSCCRPVTLASWKFACLDENQTFPTLVRDLAQGGSPYRLPDSGDTNGDTFLRQGLSTVAD
jgi:hypothetical protein